MKVIDWSASYGAAKTLLKSITGQEPSDEEVWTLVLRAVCARFVELQFVRIIENEKPEFYTLVAVGYRGKVIILVFREGDCLGCYIDDDPDRRFTRLEDACAEIDRQLSDEPETSFEP